MSRIWEGPEGELVVGAVQPGIAEGNEAPGVTKASVKVFPEEETRAPERNYLRSKDFANCESAEGLQMIATL